MGGVDVAFILLALATVVLAVTALAERLHFSAPLLLMLVGIAGSFIPGIEAPELTPELILVGLLPPLLYAAALRSSFIDFRANLRSIAYLSVLAVVVTALGVATLAAVVLPIGFAVAFAFGAVVAPPDAVAATSIARRVGLPRRLVTILEGESLVNDATAITCLQVALLAMGTHVSALEIGGGFLTAAIGGVAVGLVVVAVVVPIRRRINQPVFDTAISLMVPFAAYLPAEEIQLGGFHGSGVVAVVTAGLLLAHKSPVIQSGRSRLNERINWATLQFLLENAVFLLIGLQARPLIADIADSDLSPGTIALFCIGSLLAVIVIRLVWVGAARTFLFRLRRDTTATPAPWSHSLVIGWSGLRGVVTLAAAFLLPVEAPHREILVFGALVVTAGTLLLQGLTLPGLVRRLRLRGPDPRADALQAATVLESATGAALDALDSITRPTDDAETLDLVRTRMAARPAALWERLGSRMAEETPAEQYRRLRLAAMAVERQEVLRIRDGGTIDQEVIAEVLAALDIEESMLAVGAEQPEEYDEGPVATPESPAGSCEHLDAAPAEIEAVCDRCEDCVREGTRTVHLRVCLTCGNVGCCDSSVGRHAERHFRQSHHLVMRSMEPGESWRWCYLDQRLG